MINKAQFRWVGYTNIIKSKVHQRRFIQFQVCATDELVEYLEAHSIYWSMLTYEHRFTISIFSRASST